jgi:hypothetical protein
MDLDLPSGVRARTGVRSDVGPINDLVAGGEQFHDGMVEESRVPASTFTRSRKY